MAQRVAGVIAGIAALALVGALAWFVYGTPGSVFTEENEHTISPLATGGQPVSITVRQGESAKDIGQELVDARVVRSRRLFEVLVALTGVGNSLEAGDYEFDPGMPAIEVVERIAEGKTASRDVNIPEGRSLDEVGAILEKDGIVTKQAFLDALVKGGYNIPFLAQVPGDDLTGYVFPASYSFSRDATASEVVETMLRGFQTNVADKVQLEGQSMTLPEVVTLASIVEREAATPSERPTIASVFLNRLRDGMPLQADPTVQYALAKDPASVAKYGVWKQELTLDDLKVDSPYNTYENPGLPPGPISNPGLASIEAVIRPAQTNYLYFVAKNDGTHVFAETLEEHERNVQQYQQ